MQIALAQLPCREGDLAGNLERFLRAIDQAARAGADLVLSPEMHLSGFPTRTELEELAEPLSGPSLSRVAAAAREHRINVVVGFPERDTASGRIYNSAACFDRSGALLHRYRKVHRFANELDLVDPGAELTTFTLEGLQAGLLICYDIEFPEAARTLSLQGAQLLLVPSANMAPYGRVHRTLIQARALENHAFVAYCNRCGSSREFDFEGESAVIDPLGRIVGEARSGAELAVGHVDPGLFHSVGRVYSYFRDRRPDVYRAGAPSTVR